MGAIYSKLTNYPELVSESTRHYYGWKKDTPNPDDEFHNFVVSTTLDNIKLVDLRSTCPAVYNQDKLGSCTANAIAAAYEYDEIKQNEKLECISSPYVKATQTKFNIFFERLKFIK
jgi:hypothetical protein